MISSKAGRPALWALIFALLAVMAVPALASAQGRGRGQDKKAERFINGHDARDGRWDGRGPQRDRNDRDDDDRGRWRRDRNDRDNDFDNDRYDRGRWRRDRDNDRFNNRAEIRRQAASIGYSDGLNAGRIDRYNGERFNYTDEGSYWNATRGYRGYGDIDFYRRAYREAFRQGYEQGYRSSRRGGIFGGIFRP
jgi:hypothetical protein